MSEPKRDPPKCFECLDTLATDLFFLKTLNNPSRLYITARTIEPCPYCLPDGDDSYLK